MDQQPLDFSAPIQTKGSIRSRHSSAMGAKSVSEVLGRQCLSLLTAYRACGELTDIEIVEQTGIQKSSVIPRRRELMKRGLVVEVGHAKNLLTGVTNTTYGLASGSR